MKSRLEVEKNERDTLASGNLNEILVVGGAGHIGLPLSLFLFSKSKKVTILDISISAVSKINSGKMPFVEQGCDEILKQTVNSSSFQALSDLKAFEGKFWPVAIIIIGTQLIEDQQPDREGVFECLRSIIHHLSKGALLILRSTIYPGTTNLLEEKLDKLGRSDIRVVYAPERIAEGIALKELQELPQIVGANNRAASDLAKLFFMSLGNVVLETSASEAEMVKLLTNTYRFTHFAIANALYLTVENLGFNYSRIFDLMTYQYPRLDSLPKPGYVGGPCLVDHTFTKVIAFRRDAQRFTVGVIGVGFKPDIDDFRDSPIVEVMRRLKEIDVNVFYSDPYASIEEFDKLTIEELQEVSDVLVVGTPHSAYRSLRLTKPCISVWI